MKEKNKQLTVKLKEVAEQILLEKIRNPTKYTDDILEDLVMKRNKLINKQFECGIVLIAKVASNQNYSFF